MDDAYEEYAKNMRKARQFAFFGITPVWHPGEKDVEGFCHDEVVRQFHDTREWEDGGKRVEWMLNAWRYAEGLAVHTPTLEDVLRLGAEVEPDDNATRNSPEGRFRSENVYIGDRMGVYPPYIHEVMEKLMPLAANVVPGKSRGYADGKNLPDVLYIESVAANGQFEDLVETVDDWYLAYEWVHPFIDGNGRTGKILHNWLNGTLDDPVLVPDYFGAGNP